MTKITTKSQMKIEAPESEKKEKKELKK